VLHLVQLTFCGGTLVAMGWYLDRRIMAESIRYL